MNLTKEEQEELEKALENFRVAKIKLKLWEMFLRKKCKLCKRKKIEDCYNCIIHKYLNKITEILYV